MKNFLQVYALNSQFFDSIALFLKILVFVLAGFITKKLWDKKVRVTALQFFSGAVFIALIIFAVNDFVKFHPGLLIITSLFSGLGADALISKYIKGKIWDKFDVVDKINKKDDEDKNNKIE